MKKNRNKQFINFILYTILNSMWDLVLSYAVSPKTQTIPLSSISKLYILPTHSHLVAILVTRVSWYHSTCVQITSILLNNGPKLPSFITICSYRCFSLLFIVNILLWLTYTLNFFIGMYTEKKHVHRVQYLGSQGPWVLKHPSTRNSSSPGYHVTW